MNRIVHIEGICGAGKSTTAERVCGLFNDHDYAAQWYLEESRDHPVRPAYARDCPIDGRYSAVLLRAWSNYLGHPQNGYQFLEGYAFQSTVRFMFEYLRPRKEISDYFEHWSELAMGRHSLVYFEVGDLAAHMDMTISDRGPDWMSKVCSYVEHTPYAVSRSLVGRQGFEDFWSSYQDFCLGLLVRSDIPHVVLPARSREWTSADVSTLVAGDLPNSSG